MSTSTEHADDVKPTTHAPIIVLAILGVTLLWALGGLLSYAWGPPSNGGEFGDMFGAVTALFTGLAFAGVIWTVRLQAEELRLQRAELALTRTEIRGQTEALRQQSFEALFFQTLRLFRENVASARDKDHSGADFWQVFYDHCVDKLLEKIPKGQSYDSALNTLYFSYVSIIGPYLRTLKELLQFIEQAPPEQSRVYLKMLRAQFMPQELGIIWGYGLTKGEHDLKALIERHHLFEGLFLGNLEAYRDRYEKSAYQDS
jgi:Putative phage abortive infection protein